MRTRRAFKGKQKVFFVIVKQLSVAKCCLRPDSVPSKKTSEVETIELDVYNLDQNLLVNYHLSVHTFSVSVLTPTQKIVLSKFW